MGYLSLRRERDKDGQHTERLTGLVTHRGLVDEPVLAVASPA